MITILIKTDSHFKVDRKRIRLTVLSFLSEKQVKGKAEVSISVVGDRQMRKLNKEYRNIDKTTNVLAFPLSGGTAKTQFVDPPDDTLRLGDIIISYPQVINESRDDDMLVDDKIDELIIHGLKNLLGIGE